MREIAQAIGSEGFKEFKTKDVKVNVLTMTQYDKSFPFDALFPPEDIQNTLAQVISNAGLKQLHTAETEKYAHVTFFLNGGVEEPVLNESRVLIPSPKIATYDLQPAMSAPQVGKIVLKAMDEKYDFIVVNFANGDMVGHTGNYEAGVKAVQAVDKELGNILDKAKDQDYSVLITSDHGNCEQMKDENGNTLTNHTTFEVFCFLVDKNIKKINNGALCNIAPTVLELMGLEVPKQMNESLLSE
jgi:2,3-bisphosphoglycerate-independent phosphoglycerate mutase